MQFQGSLLQQHRDTQERAIAVSASAVTALEFKACCPFSYCLFFRGAAMLDHGGAKKNMDLCLQAAFLSCDSRAMAIIWSRGRDKKSVIVMWSL